MRKERGVVERERARVGLGEMLAPCRCPYCDGDLSPILPALQTSVIAAEIVARRALEGHSTTSRDVASLLDLPMNQTQRILLRAHQERLITRRGERLRQGGFHYLYWPDARAIAFLPAPTLRADLRALLGTVARSA